MSKTSLLFSSESTPYVKSIKLFNVDSDSFNKLTLNSWGLLYWDFKKKNLNNKSNTDLLALDIKYALNHLGEITGEVTNDEILGNIFSKFCIGKWNRI